MTQLTCKGVKQINNRISLNRISQRFSSVREFQMGEFSEILIAKCRSRFYCTWFFSRVKNFCWGEDRAGGKGVCGRLMSPAQETQSMQEIRLLRGRVNRYDRGPSIDASYHVSVHLAMRCQRRRFLKIGQTTDAKWWQKLKKIDTCVYLLQMQFFLF
jgi:hypothetical protein